MVRKRGLEPLHLSIPGFKSSASTDFATPAGNSLVRVWRFELQTSHYRGGHSTRLSYTLNRRRSAISSNRPPGEITRTFDPDGDGHASANSGSRPRDLRSAIDRRSTTELCSQCQSGRLRTDDLRLPETARYQTALHPVFQDLVRMRGFEPPRACAHGDLNAARLPIPPHPHVVFHGRSRELV